MRQKLDSPRKWIKIIFIEQWQILRRKSKDGWHHPLLAACDWPRCLLHRLPGKTEKCKFKKTLNVISGFGGLCYPQLLLSLSKAVLTADAYKDRKLTLSSVRRCLENKMEKVLAQQGMLMLFVYFCCFCSHSRRCWCYSPTLTFYCQRATTMRTGITNGFSNFSRFSKQQAFVPYFREFSNNRSSFHIFASCSRWREWAYREVEEYERTQQGNLLAQAPTFNFEFRFDTLGILTTLAFMTFVRLLAVWHTLTLLAH